MHALKKYIFHQKACLYLLLISLLAKAVNLAMQASDPVFKSHLDQIPEYFVMHHTCIWLAIFDFVKLQSYAILHVVRCIRKEVTI